MTSPNSNTRFASPARPKRTVLVAVRVTPAEAEVIDGLARHLDVEGGRCGVLRAGLDALRREIAAPAPEGDAAAE